MSTPLDADRLIHGYLDGTLSDEEAARLNDWAGADPAHARRLALALLQHDRLRNHFRALAQIAEAEARAHRARPAGRGRWRRLPVAALAAAILAGVFLLLDRIADPPLQAAEAQLDRLIEAADRPGVRTYRISAPAGREATPDALRTDGRPQPRIDGALLHVGPGGRYVLERKGPGDDVFLTGSDGRLAWSIPPDGPVRVSDDPTRFRGAVPGEQQDLPFLDLRSGLGQLREAYELDLGPAAPGSSTRRLAGRKRSPEYRGPRLVTVDFDDATGVIRRMELDGLPRARGGPRRLVLDLIAEDDPGPSFFDHASHHDPGRRVVRESKETP